MADQTPNANPSQPYLPAPAPAPRRVPRPTPIGVLAGLVLLLLCVAGGVTLAMLSSGRTDATPTPSPATAVAQNASTATPFLTGAGPTATQPALPAQPGTPTAAGTHAQPSGPVPTGALPAAVGTAGAPGPAPVSTAGAAPIATTALASVTVPPPGDTPTPLLSPTATAVPPSPTPAIGASEAGYIADFQAQTARWSAALTAFNAVLADGAPADPAWVARARGAAAPIKLLARDASQLQAPPNLGAVDTEYKAGAAHYAQAVALLERWLSAQDAQTLQQFNTEMRAGSAALQSAENQMAAFQANPSGGPAPPPLPPVVAPLTPTPTLAPPTAVPTATAGSTTDLRLVPPSPTPGTNDINTTAGDSTS